jgi:hypothetical protein
MAESHLFGAAWQRSERPGARLATKEHKHGEVSAKYPQKQVAYGQFDLDVGPADGLKDVQRKSMAPPA